MTLKYFSEDEFKCKCNCGMDVSDDLKHKLDLAREMAGTPFTIESGARCEKHNKAVGGSPASSHMRGIAVDIRCSTSPARWAIIEGLLGAGFKRIGIADSFIHADIDEDKVNKVIWTYSMAGKGSAPRKGRDDKKYAQNWDRIFGKPKPPASNTDQAA